MERDVLRKVQMTQLEITKEIHRICEENGIRYFMSGGTFLGAIRHKGFIPWDDDMDLNMLREDYEKFCRIAPEKLSAQYALQTWYTDPNYSLPFGKVVKRNTVYLEGKKSDRLQENGIYVDIFPIDHAPKDTAEREALAAKELKLFRVKLMKSGYQPWMENGKMLWKKRLGYLYYQILALFTTQQKLAEQYDALAQSVSPSGVMTEQTAYPKPDYYDAAIFSDFAEYDFEDVKLVGVRDYDGYLSTLYGDYMTPPPADQREDRHQIVEIDFGQE